MTVSRGPARWIRAAENSVNHPNSAGARLFALRLRTAFRALDESSDNTKRGAFVKVAGGKTQYYTCSTVCTVLQGLLDFSYSFTEPEPGDTCYSMSQVEQLLAEGYVPRWNEWTKTFRTHMQVDFDATPTRDVRCQVCGATITGGPKSAVNNDAKLDLEAHHERILGYPQFYSLIETPLPDPEEPAKEDDGMVWVVVDQDLGTFITLDEKAKFFRMSQREMDMLSRLEHEEVREWAATYDGEDYLG